MHNGMEEIVKRVIFTLFAIAIAIVKTGHTQTVDCDYVFTNLERAICTNPELDKLDKELERLLTLAVSENSMTSRAVREMRNQLALRCGTAENVAACLIVREQEAIARLSLLTGQMIEIAASHRPTGLSVTRYEVLKSTLTKAENLHLESGRLEELVSATLELLDTYRSNGVRHLPAELRGYEIQALESRLMTGCRNLREQRYWERALQERGQSCADGLRIDEPG